MKQFLAGTVVGGVAGAAVGGFTVFAQLMTNDEIRDAVAKVWAERIVEWLEVGGESGENVFRLSESRSARVRKLARETSPLRRIVTEDEVNPLRGYLNYEVPADGELNRVFDSANLNWSMNHESNKIFLNTQRNYLHDLLNSRGHVFLNEVYDVLGFDRTSHGAVLGWVKEDARTFIFDYEVIKDTYVLDILIHGAEIVFDRIEDQEQQGV